MRARHNSTAFLFADTICSASINIRYIYLIFLSALFPISAFSYGRVIPHNVRSIFYFFVFVFNSAVIICGSLCIVFHFCNNDCFIWSIDANLPLAELSLFVLRRLGEGKILLVLNVGKASGPEVKKKNGSETYCAHIEVLVRISAFLSFIFLRYTVYFIPILASKCFTSSFCNIICYFSCLFQIFYTHVAYSWSFLAVWRWNILPPDVYRAIFLIKRSVVFRFYQSPTFKTIPVNMIYQILKRTCFKSLNAIFSLRRWFQTCWTRNIWFAFFSLIAFFG